MTGKERKPDYGGIDSRELEEFLKEADTVAQVLRGHLAVEAVLTEALTTKMHLPQELRDMRLSFARKVQLATALGLIPDFEKPSFMALNAMRNSLAHQYHYVVTKEDADKLVSALPEQWRLFDAVAEVLQQETLSGTLTVGILVVYTMAQFAVERVLDEHAAAKRLREVLDRSKARSAREAL